MKLFSSLLLLTMSTVAFASGGKHKIYEGQFLDRMIEHHKEGVDMANMATEKAESPEVKQMSANMAATQKKEIEMMKYWRAEMFPDVPKAKSKDMPPKMDMTRLNSAEGKNFDREYLKMMSEHHDSGIKMFEEAKAKADTDKIRNFSKKSIEHQSQEKDQMQRMSTQL